MKSESVSHSVVYESATPWMAACQAPLSRGFSRRECWSGLSFPSPEDLSDPRVEPSSPVLQADSFLIWYCMQISSPIPGLPFQSADSVLRCTKPLILMNPVCFVSSFYAHAFGVPSKKPNSESQTFSRFLSRVFFFFFSLKILFVLILISHYLILG